MLVVNKFVVCDNVMVNFLCVNDAGQAGSCPAGDRIN
jgi:hypothetical protein